jgi:hypothetical protein
LLSRSALGGDIRPGLVNVGETSFFGELDAWVSELRASEGETYPVVDLQFCSAAVDLGAPLDPSPRDLRGSERPFAVTIGPPATSITDSGAVEAHELFAPCPLVPPIIDGVASVAATLTRTGAPVWRHQYGTAPSRMWQRCATASGDDCTDIEPATELTYVVSEDDIGSFLRIASRLDNQVATDAMFSNRIGPILGVPPTFDGTPTIEGSAERCGELTLVLPPIDGIPAPDEDSREIIWRACDGDDVCTDVANDTLVYTPGLAEVGLRIEVTVTITTVAGELREVVATGPVAPVAAPICVLTRIESSGSDDEFTITGEVVESGNCTLSLLTASQPSDSPPIPSQPSFGPDQTFTVDVPGVDGESAFECFTVDGFGGSNTTTYTVDFGECTTAGDCDQTTFDCTAPTNEGDPCGATPDACQSSLCITGTCTQSFTVCTDGNLCTDDTCDATTGCLFANNTAPCNDGDLCTTNDTCAGGACASGAPVVCSTENPCLTAACDTSTGSCVELSLADGTPCSDNDPCNGDETCQAGECSDGDALDCADLAPGPCETTICDPVEGCSLELLANDSPCNSDTICGGVCTDGLCGGGVAIDCTSDDPCETGVCDEANFECVFSPIAGCGEDVGVDAGPDAGPDAGEDAALDADPEDAVDIGADAEGDTAPDAAPETGAEVDEDGAAYLAGSGVLGCQTAPGQRSLPNVLLYGTLLAAGLLVRRRRFA